MSIFFTTNSRFLEIGLVNNMPDAALEATERQYLSLLGEAAGDEFQVRLTPYALPNVIRGDLGRSHVRSYEGVDDLLSRTLDGLIVTGAEPRAPNIRDEPFWGNLTQLLDWAEDNSCSAVWSCLAAQAGVLHIDGIPRQPLGGKKCGVFQSPRVEDHFLMAGVSSCLHMPHSRWNEIPEDELRSCGYRILTRSKEAGVDVFVKQRKSLFIFLQGHPEYEADTLLLEYRRDVRRFVNRECGTYPAMPHAYFSEAVVAVLTTLRERALSNPREEIVADFPTAMATAAVTNTWRRDAVRFYRNWLVWMAERKNRGLKARVQLGPAHVAAG